MLSRPEPPVILDVRSALPDMPPDRDVVVYCS